MRAQICNQMSDCIGFTPLLRLKSHKYPGEILLKLETMNPNGSMKDRPALNMIEDAERAGILKPGGTIVESTSGNTGLGLAMLAAERGYKFIAIVDGHAAEEKISIMQAYGAEIIKLPSDKSALATADREALAEQMARDNPNIYWTKQHDNPANSAAYSNTLANEVLTATAGKIDILIAAVGTGGSLCGTAGKIKALIPTLKVIGVEPEGSIAFGGVAKPYYQSGTGTPEGAAIGELVDYTLIDEGIKVSDRAAFNTARYLARKRGILIGGSAGGVIYAALQKLAEFTTPVRIVIIIADGGGKYLNTIFNDKWMNDKQLLDASIEQELDALLT